MLFVNENYRLLNELKSILRHNCLFEDEREEIEDAVRFVDRCYACRLAMVVNFW